MVCAGAQAQEQRGVVFAGASGGQDRSAYLGVGAALPGSRLGAGWAVRLAASTGDYDYSSSGRKIEAEYSGGEALLVYQWSGAWGYANIAAGPRYTDTDLSPDDPSNDRRGKQWSAGVAVDGAKVMGPWRVSGFASYGLRREEYYTRLDLTRAVGASGMRLGVEVGAEGDPGYDRQRLGAVAAFAPASNWELRVSAGVRDGDSSTGGYAALGITRTF
jgi:hypothetical protein